MRQWTTDTSLTSLVTEDGARGGGIGSHPEAGSGKLLQSDFAACVWIPLFAIRTEEVRRPELVARPAAVLSPEDTRRLWQVSPLARRHGVRSGLTVSQAIGLCPALTLCEPDPVYYDEQFARLLLALSHVSPVIEPAELGRAYVGVDGLERLYGDPEAQLRLIANRTCTAPAASQALHPLHSHLRLGWGRGKFVAWVAASRAAAGGAVIVPESQRAAFLASQPIAVLPLDADTHRRLRQLGLKTLGDLTALPESAMASQFGSPGRVLWQLAAGRLSEPVLGREVPQPIIVEVDFPSPVADRGILAHTLTRLIERALQHPRRTGFRIHVVRARAALEQGASWMAEATLKDPSADRDRIAAPLIVRLEQAPPTGAVERLAVEFVAFAPGTAELQLFAHDAASAARAGRRRALRAAVDEIRTRLKRPMLHHIIEVQPWSRLPERRYALIDYEA